MKRDLSITDEMIDDWLHRCILYLTNAGIKAQELVGIVPINETTIHGHIWIVFKTTHRQTQSTEAFQFFYRLTEDEQKTRVVSMIRKMVDNCELRVEWKANRERLVPTTPLEELAKILKG